MKNGFITVINANGQINATPAPALKSLSNTVIITQIPDAIYIDYLETYFAPIAQELDSYDLKVTTIYSTYNEDNGGGYHYITLKSSQGFYNPYIIQLLSEAFPLDTDISFEAPEISYMLDTETFTIKQPYTL